MERIAEAVFQRLVKRHPLAASEHEVHFGNIKPLMTGFCLRPEMDIQNIQPLTSRLDPRLERRGGQQPPRAYKRPSFKSNTNPNSSSTLGNHVGFYQVPTLQEDSDPHRNHGIPQSYKIVRLLAHRQSALVTLNNIIIMNIHKKTNPHHNDSFSS